MTGIGGEIIPNGRRITARTKKGIGNNIRSEYRRVLEIGICQ
jgi:hypothetical protein